MAPLPRLTRRAWLGGAIAATASAVPGIPAFGQQMQTHMPPGTAPKPKGPAVFLDYDQEELDAAYTQLAWAPNQAELGKRNAQKSRAAVARLGPRRLAYGPSEVEKLDLFATRQAPPWM
jgi:arylformamidase